MKNLLLERAHYWTLTFKKFWLNNSIMSRVHGLWKQKEPTPETLAFLREDSFNR